jgi:hypothetical protein
VHRQLAWRGAELFLSLFFVFVGGFCLGAYLASSAFFSSSFFYQDITVASLVPAGGECY